MRNISKILMILLIAILNLAKSEESMFLSDKDSEKILSMLKESKNRIGNNFKVTGIVFINNEDWVVWINNKAYSSIGENGEFSIDEVNENTVVITQNDGKTLTLSVE